MGILYEVQIKKVWCIQEMESNGGDWDGMRVKKLQSDNGGEYEDSEFKKFYYKTRIELEKTILGTPL